MDAVLRIVAIIFAVIALVYFFLSLARTAIVNRPSKDPIADFVKSIVYRIFKGLRRNRKLASDHQRLSAWYMPIYIIVLIATWFLVVMLAFTVLYWAVNAETTLSAALVSSGSALTTLGFHTPTTLQGEFLSMLEGAIGLIIVVFILTFVPGYQAAVQARELQVAWLHRRLGAKPTGIGVLLWLQRNNTGSAADFWSTWESWFRQIQATHMLAPEVIYTPSVFAGQSWVSCMSALLDAAAIQMAATDERHASVPAICAEEGIDTVHNLSRTLGFAPEQQPSHLEYVNSEQFACVLQQLAAAGVSLAYDEASAWQRFAATRVRYEQPLHYISVQTLTQDYLEFLSPAAPA